MRGGRLCRAGLCMAGFHSAAARQGHLSLRVIAISLVRAKKLVSVEDAPSAPLRGEDEYPRMPMVLDLMGLRMKNPVTETQLPQPQACYE